ncbi:Salivary acidic proline-rich phosphoprotein 1/2 [Cladophialophora chaetospira]|uniref:RNA helicase n=1 Tax=Cladophialophora chaetospira TaxID=386627 RepID=A0AA39CI68_9EURO|nr:Salivary acidic proline-rich phosphoprotein 1/2 [Cladophialophora chaetospira]
MSVGKGRKRTVNGALKTESSSQQHVSRGKVVNFPTDITDDHVDERDTEFGAKSGSSTAKIDKAASLKERARQLQVSRQGLPIYNHADKIRQKLRHHDVLLLVGETGSGKSTQVPQFLFNETWCRKQKIAAGVNQGANVGGCIAITQPRRVAAISLARRVAEEMGTPLGNSSPASQVGYSVRFENSTSPSTRIKFLTEGMLLQEMLRDPWLREYSAVVVDEVHERGVNVDLVLGFLRRMQGIRQEKDGRGGVPMKIVVMSATADMEKVEGFFNSKWSSEAGRVSESNGDEEWSGFSDDDSTPVASSLFIKGRQFPVTINYTPTPLPDVLDAAYQRILQIHSHTALPGDVLVFLTGQETVESLLSLLTSWSHAIQKDPKQSQAVPKLLVLPLYAALPSNMQQRVFQPTPKFTRKIILATNIAETSITVPGIRYVVDTGKAKQRLFRPSLNLDTLLTVPISRSSANQRSGRAGRDTPGTAYRLYTETDFYQLAQDTEPEILRCDLSQLALTLKAHSIDNLGEFPFLTPPPRRALERAMIHLLQLSAIDSSTGQITNIGKEMSVLPLPASLARVLLASADSVYGCVNEIIDIVSALSVENIFLNIHNPATSLKSIDPLGLTSKPSVDNDNLDLEDDSSESKAQHARCQLFRREGDHLTLLATMQAYAAENTDRRRWCEERYISHRAMSGAMDVKKQLTALMERYQARAKDRDKRDKVTKRHGREIDPVPEQDDTTLPTRILRCMLSGFHPNVARLCADGSYRTVLTNQPVAIHPSSVLFSVPSGPVGDERIGGKAQARKFEGIMYNEFVYTGTKAYARGVSAIELRWLEEILLD